MALPDRECPGCDGSGLRIDPGMTRYSRPDCFRELPEAQVLVERCDTCNRYASDEAAARALSPTACCVPCADGGEHWSIPQDTVRRHVVEDFSEYDVTVQGYVRNEVGHPLSRIYKLLAAKLQAEDLIDEYFCVHCEAEGERWPIRARWIAVFPVTGGSEGHYVHVEAIEGQREFSHRHNYSEPPLTVTCKAGHRRLLFLAKTFLGMDHAWKITQCLAKTIGV